MSWAKKVFRHRTKVLGLLALAALFFGLIDVFEVPVREVLLMTVTALFLLLLIIALAFIVAWTMRRLSSKRGDKP